MNYLKGDKPFYYQIGFSILIFLVAVVWVSTFFYLLGVPMLRCTVLLAFGLTVAFINRTERLAPKETLQLAVVLAGTIFICAVMSASVYDFSFDGNTYHKTTIGMLKNGWNPVYESFDDAALTLKIIPDFSWPIWYDHYPKASWIIAAAFYALSGNIEMGKCMSPLMVIAVFLMLLAMMEKYQLFKRWERVAVAFIAVINPTTLPQMQSYYNDGMMLMLIFVCLISLIDLTLSNKRDIWNQNWFAIFAAIQLALNIKYSGLIFLGLYCGAFYFYWLVYDRKTGIAAAKKNLIHSTVFYIAAVGTAVCFTGSTSYMRNLIHHHNPLYTMIGEDKIEIIASMLPDTYANKPYIYQFFHSLFSRASNISAGSGLSPELKIPFTFNQAEFETGMLFDLRIGAWGLLFSGIFLICVVILIPLMRDLYRSRKDHAQVFQVIVLIFAITFGQILVVPGLAWARYYGHLFILPITVIGFLFYKGETIRKKLTAYFLALLLVLNVGNFGYYCIQRINISQHVRMELGHIAHLSREQTVAVHLNGGDDMQGYLFNLMDADVDYVVDPDMQDGTTILNWQINYKVLP